MEGCYLHKILNLDEDILSMFLNSGFSFHIQRFDGTKNPISLPLDIKGEGKASLSGRNNGGISSV